MEEDLPGEEEGGSHLQETGNRKETERTSLGCHKEISALSLFPTFFFAKHSKKKKFSIQKSGAGTATCGAPALFYSCDKCQSLAQTLPRCGVLLDPQASLPRSLQQEKLIPL